jgi:hypothetical protein
MWKVGVEILQFITKFWYQNVIKICCSSYDYNILNYLIIINFTSGCWALALAPTKIINYIIIIIIIIITIILITIMQPTRE